MNRKKLKNPAADYPTVSANEFTGSNQHTVPTEEELKEFHKEFNKK